MQASRKFSLQPMPQISCKFSFVIRSHMIIPSNFISRIAGSETTATTLTVITYYLCRDEDILKKLQKEIRGAFKHYDEIDATSAASLRYLRAVCLEALRIFPPLPLGLPREVPNGGDTVDGNFIPEGVSRDQAPERHVSNSC